jgi:hypothetical protein
VPGLRVLPHDSIVRLPAEFVREHVFGHAGRRRRRSRPSALPTLLLLLWGGTSAIVVVVVVVVFVVAQCVDEKVVVVRAVVVVSPLDGSLPRHGVGDHDKSRRGNRVDVD